MAWHEVGREPRHWRSTSAKPVRLVYYPNDKNQSHSALFMDQSAPESACEDLAREFFKQHY